MKKILIAGAVAALVSTGAMAGKPPKQPDLTPRVEALETSVSQLSSDTQQLQTDIITNQERISELELSAGEDTYIVYDATGRVVGTTVDGLEIRAQFEGFDNTFFMIHRSQLLDPMNTGTESLIYLEQDCMGEPYRSPQVGAANSQLPALEGVDYLSTISIGEYGSYWSSDQVTPSFLLEGSFSYYNSSSRVCQSFPDGVGGLTIFLCPRYR